MRLLIVGLIALLAACPQGGPTQVGVQPSWRAAQITAVPQVQASTITFAPSDSAATNYNETPVAAPHTDLDDAVTAAVSDAAHAAKITPPFPDARLFRACQELAEAVPEQGVVSYELVEFALQRNGIVEPSPHLLVVWGNVDSPSSIVDQLKPRLAELLGDGATARLGVGAVHRATKDGNGVVVFALQASWLRSTPIPRTIAAGGSFPLDATIDPRYHDPEVFVTHDDGSTERLPLAVGQGGEIQTTLACRQHTGRQQVEVTGSDASGSTVLANFPIWCGAEPPPSLTVAPVDDSPIADASDAEKRLLALVNRDRLKANLPALIWDDKVAAVARGHSEEMHATKIVAHISPTTGSAADRVRAANIRTGVVLENVARAYGVGEAHEGLMNSPGHRANIMSPSATHIGIGVVLGDEVSGRREMFLTQVFIRKPPHVDPTRAADEVRARLVAARPGLVNEARLTSIAQGLADALAAGQTREQAWPTVSKRVNALNAGYARVGSVVTAVGDLSTVDANTLLGDSHPDEAGVGIAQGPHPELGDNAIWIVVLMADKKK
jgi:uncharacterized protein YkwD|nr:CAP domain-containing protein [Kofleriaceae bacterium]